VNAALLAAEILALADSELERRLRAFRKAQSQKVLDEPDPSAS
jgi:5-(carboxyamino)imidazole ribonucleotide mutase